MIHAEHKGHDSCVTDRLLHGVHSTGTTHGNIPTQSHTGGGRHVTLLPHQETGKTVCMWCHLHNAHPHPPGGPFHTRSYTSSSWRPAVRGPSCCWAQLL
jgi:hypothetical protein